MGFFSCLARWHTVLACDKQGCGLSGRDRTGFGRERDVEDAWTVVSQLSPERLSIFGTSPGGPVDVADAAARPEQVERLVLYDSRGRGADVSRDGGTSFVALGRARGLGSRTMVTLFRPASLDDPTALGVVLKGERAAATRDMASRLLEGDGHVPWLGDVEGVLRPVAELLGDDVTGGARPFEAQARSRPAAAAAPGWAEVRERTRFIQSTR